MSFGALPELDPVLETNDDFMTPAAPIAATDKAHQDRVLSVPSAVSAR